MKDRENGHTKLLDGQQHLVEASRVFQFCQRSRPCGGVGPPALALTLLCREH
jgi:hypothetical protein